MRKGTVVLFLSTALLATSAFAVGIKGPARPHKSESQVSEELSSILVYEA